MRYGIYLAIAGILVACLLGCSVRRSGSLHDSGKSEEQGRYDLLYARTDAKVATSNTVVDRFKDIRIYWRTYDTDKPADAEGRHPVKTEGWTEGEEQESAAVAKETTENSQENAQADAESKKTNSFEKNDSREFEAEAGTQPLWWWLIGLLSALIGIVFIWWKYGKKNQTK